MSGLFDRVVQQFGSNIGEGELPRRAWYAMTAKAGPNAVMKIMIPPARERGYVLTVARHIGTPVIGHEVSTLERLRKELPPPLRSSIPTVLDHGECEGVAYFAIPFYNSFGDHRVARRVLRAKRTKWIVRWLTDLARHTLKYDLTRESLEGEFSKTVAAIQNDSRVSNEVKRQVRDSLESVCQAATQIPSVCCHGDLWSGNVLWQRRSEGAVILDWGAARWPGLPGVDLCRFMLARPTPSEQFASTIRDYCQAIDLDPARVPALYELYNVFIKAELDVAYAMQPTGKFDPFLDGNPSQRISRLLLV